MSYSVFTFRTNPYIDQIRDTFGEPFIFGSLKKDLEVYREQLKKSHPDYIIGLAVSDKTYIEPVAVNRFHGARNIVSEGPEQIKLFAPTQISLPLRAAPTHSFCNYVAYQLSYHLRFESSTSRRIFIHYRLTDSTAVFEELKWIMK